MPERRAYTFRADGEILDRAGRQADGEGVALAVVLRVFVQRYAEGLIRLSDLLSMGGLAPEDFGDYNES